MYEKDTSLDENWSLSTVVEMLPANITVHLHYLLSIYIEILKFTVKLILYQILKESLRIYTNVLH